MGCNISVQEVGNRWVKNSLRSYLEGEKNLKWITGILKGANKNKIQSLFDALNHSAIAKRKAEFQEWLNRADLSRDKLMP
jgi:hypothetical protein